MNELGGHILNLYKKLGETPRERLERLRVQKPQYQYEVLSYAGRLDPMAEGVLVCLVGAENARHDQHLDMSKEYTLDILFGFGTDTYDVLGKVLQHGGEERVTRSAIEDGLRNFRGEVSQEYPPFSSKTVEGKPLFEWAKQGALGALAPLPRRDVTIYDIEATHFYKVKEQQLLAYIEDSVARVNGDFRQEEIMSLWHRHLRKNGMREFPCVTVKFSCSSGAYARSIANGLGAQMGTPALALHILRTKVGEYGVEKSLK
ncbi:MAG TPA: hypothetical protein VF803_01855 [Candidatus Paceibacterota bacterium]